MKIIVYYEKYWYSKTNSDAISTSKSISPTSISHIHPFPYPSPKKIPIS